VERRGFLVDFNEYVLSLGRLEDIYDTMIEMARIQPQDKVLDAGCGTGRLAVKVKERCPDAIVHGLDATEYMVQKARNRNGFDGIIFIQGLVEDMALFDESYDLMFSSYVFHHLPNHLKLAALLEAHRILKEDGRLILADYGRPTKWYGYLLSFPFRFNLVEYTRGQIHGILDECIEEAGFSCVKMASVLGFINIRELRKCNT